MEPPFLRIALPILIVAVWGAKAKVGGWDSSVQYHIQTDEGNERFFKYQTVSGQYRKEKRLQDGSVVGSYGWVDANGLLRLNDYVADDKGYRIVRSRMMRVGQGQPIDKAVAAAKRPAPVSTPLPPISLSDYLKGAQLKKPPRVEVAPNSYQSSTSSPQYSAYPTSTPAPYVAPVTFRPYYDPNTIDSDPPKHTGVYLTQNGFQYYLPRHYHEEESLGEQRAGSFGYIDPFGIRRVIYYNSAPGTGFVHRKNNRYVGFNATPYDPRF